MIKLFEDVKVLPAYSPNAVSAGTITGESIDTAEYQDAMFVVNVGNTFGTPTSMTINTKIQHSATGTGDWSDITGATMTEITSAFVTGELKLDIGKAGIKRYVRLITVVTLTAGTTPTVGVDAIALLGTPTYAPVGNALAAD
jgi:hypothetical protein